LRVILAILVLALPSGAVAQTAAPDPQWAGGWWLALGGDGTWFSSIANTTGAPPEAVADIRPTRRTGVRVAVARGFGSWRGQVEVGWAQGDAEAGNETVSVRDKTLDLSRYRLAPGVERRVAGVGAGELALGLAVPLDLWHASSNTRARLGAEGRVALRLPLGKLGLENRLAFGLSGSPLDAEDLGDGFERSSLTWLAFGVALWLPL
jgi:hypothetical protein